MRFSNLMSHLPRLLKSIGTAISIGYTGPYLLGIYTKICSIAAHEIEVNLVQLKQS